MIEPLCPWSLHFLRQKVTECHSLKERPLPSFPALGLCRSIFLAIYGVNRCHDQAGLEPNPVALIFSCRQHRSPAPSGARVPIGTSLFPATAACLTVRLPQPLPGWQIGLPLCFHILKRCGENMQKRQKLQGTVLDVLGYAP